VLGFGGRSFLRSLLLPGFSRIARVFGVVLQNGYRVVGVSGHGYALDARAFLLASRAGGMRRFSLTISSRRRRHTWLPVIRRSGRRASANR